MSSLEYNLFIKETTRSAIASMAAEQCRWGLIIKWDRKHIDCHPMSYHLVDLDNAMASSSKPKWTTKMGLLQFSREICKTTSAFQRRGWKCNNHQKNPSVRYIPQSYLALLSSPSFRGSALQCGTNIVAWRQSALPWSDSQFHQTPLSAQPTTIQCEFGFPSTAAP